MIEVNELCKRYVRTVAVDGLSFEVRPGTVTGFLGPNGAGKTTTMRVLLGLAAPSSGEALVNGGRYVDIRHPMHQVGALLDATAVHSGRSALDHLRWLARSNRIGDQRVVTVLEQVGLAGVARKRTGGFSLGMKQRLGIAAALLGDPGIMLFDEPVNGLDPDGVKWIRELMRSLAAEGRTVLVSSHLMSEMQRTAVPDGGTAPADQPPAGLVDRRGRDARMDDRGRPRAWPGHAAGGRCARRAPLGDHSLAARYTPFRALILAGARPAPFDRPCCCPQPARSAPLAPLRSSTTAPRPRQERRMADLEDRVTTLETRVDNLTTEVRFGTHLSIAAIREGRIATKAHQKNIKLLNALRKTQAEHSKTLAEHTKRLDTIDGRLDTIDGRLDTIDGRLDTIGGKLGQMTVGMHTIESLLRQVVEQD